MLSLPNWLNRFRKQPSGGGGAAPTLVFSNSALGTIGGCATSAAAATGSTLLVAGIRGYRLPLPVASSSPSNTWTALTGQVIGGGAGAIISYVGSPTTSGSQTFSVDGGDVGTQYSSVGMMGFSGVTTFDAASAGATSAGGVNHIQPGSVTPSTGNDVMIAVVSTDGGTWTFTIDSGFTIIAQGTNDGGRSFAVAYKIKTDSVAENPTFTVATGAGIPGLACVCAAFK